MSSDPSLRSQAHLSAILEVLRAIQTSMLDFYVELSRMPHVQPDSVRRPPVSGWDTLNADILRSRGKTEEAIDFVRHLPCLGHKSNLSPNTSSIDFSNGETCQAWQEQLTQTPEYVVWIAEALSRDGHYLLLDTVNGTITEFGTMGNTVRLPPSEYETLPPSDRWMAHETLPAHVWFKLERRRIQGLFYLPVPLGGSDVAYYYRASDYAHETHLLAEKEDEDDDYVDSDDGDDDNESNGSDSSSFADSEDDDRDVSTDELSDLRQSEEAVWPQSPEPGQAVTDNQSSSEHLLHPLEYSYNNAGIDKPEVTQLYEIYKRNGWPSNTFDRQRCKDALLEWQENRRAARAPAQKTRSEELWQKRLADNERRKVLLAEKAAAETS